MRALIDRRRLHQFMTEIGKHASEPGAIYFTGGASAVLLEWRSSTVDIDLQMVPEQDAIFRSIPQLKEQLQINVEIASPSHFIPPVPGWETRSPFIATAGKLSFYHYDFYSQALSKIERRHSRDVIDVAEMHRRRLIDPAKLLDFFRMIEPEFYRYPAVDPQSFRLAVEHTAAELARDGGIQAS